MTSQKRPISSVEAGEGIFHTNNEVPIRQLHPNYSGNGFIEGRVQLRYNPDQNNDTLRIRLASTDNGQRNLLDIIFHKRTQDLMDALQANAQVKISLSHAEFQDQTVKLNSKTVAKSDLLHFMVVLKDHWAVKVMETRDRELRGRKLYADSASNKRARPSRPAEEEPEQDEWFRSSPPIGTLEAYQHPETPPQASGSSLPREYMERDGMILTRMERDDTGRRVYNHDLGGHWTSPRKPAALPAPPEHHARNDQPPQQHQQPIVQAAVTGGIRSKKLKIDGFQMDPDGTVTFHGQTANQIEKELKKDTLSKTKRKKLRIALRSFKLLEVDPEPNQEAAANIEPPWDISHGWTSQSGVYHALDNLTSTQVVWFGGVVTDVLEPKKSNNGAWMRRVSLIDPTLPDNKSFDVSLFSRHKETWEKTFVKTGQALLLRQIRVSYFNSKKMGVGNDDAWRWAGYDFQEESPINITHPLSFPLEPGEMEYLGQLGKWWKNRQDALRTQQAPVTPRLTRQKEEWRIEQANQASVFFITYLEVLKVVPFDTYSEIYATDYTRPSEEYAKLEFDDEPALQNIKDYVVKIMAYGPDHDVARNMRPGKIWRFRNIRFVSTSYNGVLKTGQQDRAVDQMVDDETVEALERRKEVVLEQLRAAAEEREREELLRIEAMELAPAPEFPEDASTELPYFTGLRCKHTELSTTPIRHILNCVGGCGTKYSNISVHRLSARMIKLSPPSIEKVIKSYCVEHDLEIREGERLCRDCGDMDPGESIRHVYHIRFMAIDQDNDALVVGLGGEEAERMIGISPNEFEDGEVPKDILKKRLGPWLGNFLTDPGMAMEQGYNKEQYLDLMIQSWKAPDDQLLHSLVGCELVLEPTNS